MATRSIALFLSAAITEIGGAYLAWIGLRGHKGPLSVVLGALSLAVYDALGGLTCLVGVAIIMHGR